jgi:acetylornithine/succinyldiaminopimelate/putrescine aminotransferase
MKALTHDPVLGHITTFGGHPVCCAAGMAALQVLLRDGLIAGVGEKEQLFKTLLVHPQIKAVRSKGLLMAVQLQSAEQVTEVIRKCLERGVFTDWFLFAADCIRIAPPLTITVEEIKEACTLLMDCL